MATSMLTLFLVIFGIILVEGQNSCNTCDDVGPIDYYWRDYVGKIPCDAIEGGTDKAGNLTYIGQIYFKEFELLPATIYANSPIATASAYDKVQTSDKNIKILCSRNKHRYQWVVTKNEETQLLINCHLVIGGTEVGAQLNIGRVNYEGAVVIGKVFSNPLPNRGCYIPHDGHEVGFQEYEILTYNCNFTNNCHNSNNCIDTRAAVFK